MEIPALFFADPGEAELALTDYALHARQLGAYRNLLVRGACAAGVRAGRMTELTGIAGTTLARVPLDKGAAVGVPNPPRQAYARIIRLRARRLFDQAGGISEDAGRLHGKAFTFEVAARFLDGEDPGTLGWLTGVTETDDAALALFAADCAAALTDNPPMEPAADVPNRDWSRGRNRGMREALHAITEELTRIRALGEAGLDPDELAESNAAIEPRTARAFDRGSLHAIGLRRQAKVLRVDEDEYMAMDDGQRLVLWAEHPPEESAE